MNIRRAAVIALVLVSLLHNSALAVASSPATGVPSTGVASESSHDHGDADTCRRATEIHPASADLALGEGDGATRVAKCYNCSGSGDCWPCSGSGKTATGDRCFICSGSGKCYYCSGKGTH